MAATAVWTTGTFFEHCNIPSNNKQHWPGLPLHAWVVSLKQQRRQDMRQRTAQTYWWPCRSQRCDVESRCLLCSHSEQQAGDQQDGRRTDFWANAARACNCFLDFFHSDHIHLETIGSDGCTSTCLDWVPGNVSNDLIIYLHNSLS